MLDEGRGAAARAPSTSRSSFNRWTLGDDFLQRRARHPRRTSTRRPGFDLLRHLGLRPRPDPRRPTTTSAARMTIEGAPHLQGRAPAGLRLRQQVRPLRQALPLARGPHPHDGGGPAVHLGRDLQDDQHAARGDRRGRRSRPTSCRWQLMLKANALYRDGCKLSQPLNSTVRRPRRGRRRRRARRIDGRQVEQVRAAGRDGHREGRRPLPRQAPPPARTAAPATRRRPSSAATRSTCAPASTRTARSARSSSTCTRRAPPSAA